MNQPKHPLLQIVEKQKQGQAVGIYSACTANEYVLRACLQRAKETNSYCLIEATANQVDQYGGYTGMKPADFKRFVEKLAEKENISMDRVILGGDHLGPLTFAHLNEEEAMKEAKTLVHDYVRAGFSKIHIDTSMKVKDDDPNTRLTDETIARRGAILASVCEQAYLELLQEEPNALHPVYIIGSEVPIPGGSQDAKDTGVQVTKPEDFKATYKAFEKAFDETGVKEAFNHVIAIVVQPGVEEKDAGCTEYDRSKAIDLMNAIKEYPKLVFEGHSTDYQTKIKLRELVEDGVGILKVGPGLTFAYREALFALAYAEKECVDQANQSHFMEVLDKAMLADPKYYQKHYHGTESEIALKRKYSFSDRCRYYLPKPEVNEAINKLISNFKNGVPLNLLSQFLPRQYTKVREGIINNNPECIIKDHIIDTVNEYLYASHQEEL